MKSGHDYIGQAVLGGLTPWNGSHLNEALVAAEPAFQVCVCGTGCVVSGVVQSQSLGMMILEPLWRASGAGKAQPLLFLVGATK